MASSQASPEARELTNMASVAGGVEQCWLTPLKSINQLGLLYWVLFFWWILRDFINLEYFPKQCVHTAGFLRYRCKGWCLIRVLQLGRGIFPVNFCIKWLLWNLQVHFDCAGSHKTCGAVLGPVLLLNIISPNIIIFLPLTSSSSTSDSIYLPKTVKSVANCSGPLRTVKGSFIIPMNKLLKFFCTN